MQIGVMGYKGKVVYHIGGCINEELDKIKSETSNRNEQIELATKLIDYHIHSNYTIYPNNKIAYDEIYGNNEFAKDYTEAEKKLFEDYLCQQIRKVDLENKDKDFLRMKILEMYANPLKNYLMTVDSRW